VAGKYTSLDAFIAGISGIVIAGLAAWGFMRKYIKFDETLKERDALRDRANADFKTEVKADMNAYSEKIEHVEAEVIELKTSTILHIDNGFKKQDKKNEELFPPATIVYAKLEKLELARESMFKEVRTEQRNLSEKQIEISDSVKEILKKLDDKAAQEMRELKEENKRLRGKS